MNLGIDVSPAVYHRGGIGVYSRALYTALNHLPDINLMPVYNRTNDNCDIAWLDRIPTILPWANKSWRLRVMLSRIFNVTQDRYFPGMDVFLATDHLLPNLHSAKQVFVVHDVSFRRTQTVSTWNKLYLGLMLPRFLRAADAVIVPSRSTSNDIQQYYNTPVNKIHVIPDAVGSHFMPVTTQACEDIRNKYALPETFILAVGTIEPRKNYESLLHAYAMLGDNVRDIPLVIAGRRGWRSAPFFELLSQMDFAGEVRLLDYVSSDDLPGLYSAATLFVFPSLYEGFGLPPLEAMACGTPVISSNTSSLPEVVGNAGLMVSPKDTQALALTMATLLNDASLQQNLRQKGLERALAFTWERCAQATLKVCRSVL